MPTDRLKTPNIEMEQLKARQSLAYHMGSLNLLINKQANSGNYQSVKELPKNKNLLTEYKTQQYLEVPKVPALLSKTPVPSGPKWHYNKAPGLSVPPGPKWQQF